MSVEQLGRYAEEEARLFLKSRGLKVIFQPDWLTRDSKGQYWLIETKHQEVYEPPPFYGHGLPLHQVIARLNFQKATGVIATLLILDKGTKNWYWQRLDILEADEYIDTHGKNPRRIYKLDNFLSLPNIYSKSLNNFALPPKEKKGTE